MDCNPPGFSVHGIFQVGVLEWVAISFSRKSSQSGIESKSLALKADSLPSEPPGGPNVCPGGAQIEGNWRCVPCEWAAAPRVSSSGLSSTSCLWTSQGLWHCPLWSSKEPRGIQEFRTWTPKSHAKYCVSSEGQKFDYARCLWTGWGYKTNPRFCLAMKKILDAKKQTEGKLDFGETHRLLELPRWHLW